jgi:hypothetical protein
MPSFLKFIFQLLIHSTSFNRFSGDFRGTKDSLKKLVSEDRYRKPLLRDIWYFYRAERLYLLQVWMNYSSYQSCARHLKFFK